MADTPRTREALLALFADNTTGQISPQDFRDFVVTAMPSEFVNAYDGWCGPLPDSLTTDRTTRGWHLYSQLVSSILANGMSFGCIYNLNASNVWSTANISLSTNNCYLGMPVSEYAANASNAAMLICGIVYNSLYSARNAGYVGYPVYLQSIDNSISITKATNSLKIIGRFLGSTVGQSTAVGTGKLFFNVSNWELKG